MDDKRRTKISKFLSLILRHQPEAVGLKLDENGWARVDDLIKACRVNGRAFNLNELREVVETNDKKRFSFDETGTRIRASQGHSIAVEIEFEKKQPPAVLFHGTAEKNVGVIFEHGLLKMKRHHVHLSADAETARKVGARHGKPAIFEIDTAAMIEKGFVFFVSANNVWLCENVPPAFLRLRKDES